MAYQSLLLGAFAGLGIRAAGLTPRASLPPVYTVTDLGLSQNPGYPNLYRDGGGGAKLNGVNLIVFSDSFVTDGAPDGNLRTFVSNTFAYTGFADPQDPTILVNFGENGLPFLAIPFTSNETSPYGPNQDRIAIWPTNNIAALDDGVSGVTCYNVIDVASTGDTVLYNTLVTVDVSNIGNPVATRTVPVLFTAPQIAYGSFSIAKANDGYMYLFGKASDGVKVARVLVNNLTDRSQYTFWTGTAWDATPPDPTNSASNIFSFIGPYNTGPATGDIFYSAHYNTWLAIFMDGFVDGIFRLTYALDGSFDGTGLTSGWSTPQDLYDTKPGANYNYAGHAYPDYDPTSNTLLLSYTYASTAYIEFALVTWG